MSKFAALCAVIALGAGGAAARGSGTAPVVVTVASFPGSVDAVAQDGPRVAWLSGTGNFDDSSCDKVVIEHLTTHARVAITQNSRGEASCTNSGNALRLALAGTRALWSSFGHGNFEYTTLWSGSTTDRSGRVLLSSIYRGGSGGAQYRGLAGSAKTLVYGVINWERTSDCPDYESTQVCPDIRRWSPIRRVEQQGGVRDVAGSYAGDGIAASGGLVATVRGARVVVLRADTGAQVGSASITRDRRFDPWPDGPALALGSTMVAVGVRSAIHVYDWRTHRLVRRVQLSEPPTGFGLSGTLLVWATSQFDCRANHGGCSEPTPCKGLCAISVMDVRTGRRSVVAHPRFDPFDVTIVGRRIVWGENAYAGRGVDLRPVHGYVRMLRLP